MSKKENNLYLLKSIAPWLIVLSISTSVRAKFLYDYLGNYFDERLKDETLRNDVVHELPEAVSQDYIEKSYEDYIKEIQSISNNHDDEVEPSKEETIVTSESIDTPTEEPIEEVDEVKKVKIHRDLLKNGYKFKTIDFDTLKSYNPDVCGWIILDDTEINYAVVMANSENSEYYLDYDEYGNKSADGAIYVDSQHNSLESDYYDLSDLTAIHGHHMVGDRMFGAIANFDNQSFYDNHKFAVIYTPDGYAYKATFIAGLVCESSDVDLVYRDFENEKQFNKFIKKIKNLSKFSTNQTANYGDKLVVFNTCYYQFNSLVVKRFLLYARLDKELIYEKKDDKKLSKKR